MKSLLKLLVVALCLAESLNPAWAAEERILFMAGAAAQPVVEPLAKAFETKTGIKVDVNIAGSGMLLSQIELSGKGDIYFPGSIDFIDKAVKDGMVDESTVTPIVYLVPSINVQKGNPHKIKTLKDLCRPGLRVAIAQPETVCLGVFAVELAERFLSPEEKKAFRANLVTYTESCEKTAAALLLKSADAVIGWSVFEYWNPELIETVKLTPDEIVRISYLAVAITKRSQHLEASKKFVEFMKSPEGLEFFKKFHYFTTAEEALAYVGADKPVGGTPYNVPAEWMK